MKNQCVLDMIVMDDAKRKSMKQVSGELHARFKALVCPPTREKEGFLAFVKTSCT